MARKTRAYQAPKVKRGERRYVTVEDRKGRLFKALTSIANPTLAVVELIPSNEHLKGKFGGMMITHGDIEKAHVFESVADRDFYIKRSLEMAPNIVFSIAQIVEGT